MIFFWICTSLLSLATRVTSFSAGAPIRACRSLSPKHGAPPQITNPPYKITYDTPFRCYIPEDTMTITLEAREGEFFIGYLIKAMLASSDIDTPGVGKFATENENVQRMCRRTAVTHTLKGAERRRRILKFQWIAPKAGTGTVMFQAVIVKEKVVFWTEVMSKPLPECGCINAVSNKMPIRLTLNARTTRITSCSEFRGILAGFCSPDAVGKARCCKFCQTRCVDSLTWKSTHIQCRRCDCATFRQDPALLKDCCMRNTNILGKGADGQIYKCSEMCCKSCNDKRNG